MFRPTMNLASSLSVVSTFGVATMLTAELDWRALSAMPKAGTDRVVEDPLESVTATWMALPNTPIARPERRSDCERPSEYPLSWEDRALKDPSSSALPMW